MNDTTFTLQDAEEIRCQAQEDAKNIKVEDGIKWTANGGGNAYEKLKNFHTNLDHYDYDQLSTDINPLDYLQD